MRRLLSAFLLTLALVAGSGVARAEQAGAVTTAVTDAQTALRQRTAEKDALASSYAAALAAVDELKKQRAGFRRDRDLREKLASSLELAKSLAAANARVVAAQAALTQANAAIVATKLDAIKRELAQPGLPEARRAVLVAERDRLAAPTVRIKKIVVPSMDIDPLADPEELEAQAAALRQSEAEITQQLEGLAKQEAAALQADELRRNHTRAMDVVNREDDQPRRSDQQARGARESADQAGTFPGPLNGGPPPGDVGVLVTPASSSLRDFGVVLADLVDKNQLAALRGAAGSSDPAVRAAVAKATRAAVQARLDVLRSKRAAMEARAVQLRQPRK